MKFSNKYSAGKTIKKQHRSDYWLLPNKNIRTTKRKLTKASDNSQQFFMNGSNATAPQKNQNIAPQPQINNNKQQYTGVDKSFQFNNNMMNMYRAAVTNSTTR